MSDYHKYKKREKPKPVEPETPPYETPSTFYGPKSTWEETKYIPPSQVKNLNKTPTYETPSTFYGTKSTWEETKYIPPSQVKNLNKTPTYETPSAIDQYTKERSKENNSDKALGCMLAPLAIGYGLLRLAKFLAIPIGATIGGVAMYTLYGNTPAELAPLPEYYDSGLAVITSVGVIVGGILGYVVSKIVR